MFGKFIVVLGLAATLPVSVLPAIQITGYSSAANNVYSSGYPSSPVSNTDPLFVGLGYDWTGVGWSVADATKSFGFVSPVHYLVARHYGGAASLGVLGPDGVETYAQATVQNTGYGVVFEGQTIGDLSLGTLANPVVGPLPRYAVLDLNLSSTSNTPAAYGNLPVFLFGRGPNGATSTRIGLTPIVGLNVTGQNMYFATDRDDVRLETGDSGSPSFIGWTNPNGGKELTIIGNNAAINVEEGYNFMNFLGTHQVMSALNTLMNGSGYALRVAGDPSATWSGSGNTQITNRISWGLPIFSSAPSDAYVLFDPAQAVNRAINVNADHNLRGLYFKAMAGTSDAFNFSGAGILTIGRGGMTNYDDARQVFTATVRLGDHQYWDAGSQGFSFNAIQTNGKLLEIGGTGTVTIAGTVSGTGGLAVSGSRVEMTGSSTYTGKTWVHDGTLVINGNIASSPAIQIAVGAVVMGTGRGSILQGGGTVEPGEGFGILTITQVNPAAGLDFRFEFSGTGAPAYTNGAASGNDLLRLIGGAPFSQALDGANDIFLFLNVEALAAGERFLGGFFTDVPADFFGSIESANFVFYVASMDGTMNYQGNWYGLYSGPLTFRLSTPAATADFGGGPVEGRILAIDVVPEPAVTTLAGFAVVAVWLFRRRK